MSNKNSLLANALLPNGFVDVLAPAANVEAIAISKLMEKFIAFGYQRIKPPLEEFESSLIPDNGQGDALANQTFRVMDPVSHRMMGIRSDITPQIARIATSRLQNEARPLRLTYANDVLRTCGNQQRTERQFCQVGCEIIGSSDIQSDIEAVVVAMSGLKALAVKDLSIDLAVPRLIDHVLDHVGVDDADRLSIKEATAKKDMRTVCDVNEKVGEILQALFDMSGDAADCITRLKSSDVATIASDLVQALSLVVDGLTQAITDLGYEDVNVTIDPLEFAGFDYQNGVAFTLFSPHVRGEMGRGGRYHVKSVSDRAVKEDAVGFTLYMDTVRTAMPEIKDGETTTVSSSMSWSDIEKKQKQGFIVKRDLK
jgi:ATP phosphoribosyltransferase regulatory subunit